MRVRKAVIPAAGLGTRQYPATSYLRKGFFVLVDRDGYARPAIQLVVEEALAAGVEEVCIVCRPETELACRAHFSPLAGPLRERLAGDERAVRQSKRLEDIGRRLHFVTQTSQDGLGHAVWCAREWVGDEPFLTLLGDHVFVSRTGRRCAAQLLDAFDGHSVTALTPVGEAGLSGFGAARGRLVDAAAGLVAVEGFVEKPPLDVARRSCRVEGLPEGRYLVHFGMHVFRPGVMEVLDGMIAADRRERGEFQLTAAQDALCRLGPYRGRIIEGARYDIGTPMGLLEAQMALALAGPYRDTVEEMWRRAREPLPGDASERK